MEQGRENVGRICPRGASYYTWEAGDTLARVAQINGTTEQALRDTNRGVDFATLPAGETICIPANVLTCPDGEPYTVRQGDTFASIADSLGIGVDTLQSRNQGTDPNALTTGQVICIPRQTTGGGVTQPQTPPTTGGTQTPPSTGGTQTPPSTGGTLLPPIINLSCPVGYTPTEVKAGQTYADLLIQQNVSYRAMRTSNPALRPGALRAGMRFCSPPAGTRQLCERNRSYVIQPGETLTSLAQKLNTTTGRLLMLNPTLLPTDFSSGTIICLP